MTEGQALAEMEDRWDAAQAQGRAQPYVDEWLERHQACAAQDKTWQAECQGQTVLGCDLHPEDTMMW